MDTLLESRAFAACQTTSQTSPIHASRGASLARCGEVLLLVMCATVTSCDDFDDLAKWGEAHLSFLRGQSRAHHGRQAKLEITKSARRLGLELPRLNSQAHRLLTRIVTLGPSRRWS